MACHTLRQTTSLFFHSSAGTFSSLRETLQRKHDEVIARRYPYYEEAIHAARSAIGPLSRSLAAARTATTGSISVTIDGRSLGPHLTGTQVHTLELVRGLAACADELRLRVIVPDDVGAEAEALLEELGVERIRYGDASTRTLTDIVHRPYQVFRGDDLRLLPQLGERIVITQQDLIAYRNPWLLCRCG